MFAIAFAILSVEKLVLGSVEIASILSRSCVESISTCVQSSNLKRREEEWDWKKCSEAHLSLSLWVGPA